MSKIGNYVIQLEQEGAIYYDEFCGRYKYSDRKKQRDSPRGQGENGPETFLEMVNGDSIFLESEAPKRTMHAIRASVSRFYDKIGKDHKLVCQEEDKGVRIFKLKGES